MSWYEKIDSFFLQAGYNRSKNDPNLYTMQDEQGRMVMISLYVDDFIITGDATYLIKEIKQQMSQSEDGSKEADVTLYRQLVGSLIYLTTTRPDLDYAVSVLSQYMSKSLESHWNAAKSVLRYLQGTVDYGIIYIDSSDVRLTGFADSNWVRNVDDRRSITGYAFSIGSGVITRSSNKQNTVSLSSAEAEYQAMCATTCEVIWLRRLL
eukprot:PITA_14400